MYISKRKISEYNANFFIFKMNNDSIVYQTDVRKIFISDNQNKITKIDFERDSEMCIKTFFQDKVFYCLLKQTDTLIITDFNLVEPAKYSISLGNHIYDLKHLKRGERAIRFVASDKYKRFLFDYDFNLLTRKLSYEIIGRDQIQCFELSIGNYSIFKYDFNAEVLHHRIYIYLIFD